MELGEAIEKNKELERYQKLRAELRKMCDSHHMFLVKTEVENLLIEVNNS